MLKCTPPPLPLRKEAVTIIRLCPSVSYFYSFFPFSLHNKSYPKTLYFNIEMLLQRFLGIDIFSNLKNLRGGGKNCNTQRYWSGRDRLDIDIGSGGNNNPPPLVAQLFLCCVCSICPSVSPCLFILNCSFSLPFISIFHEQGSTLNLWIYKFIFNNKLYLSTQLQSRMHI